jgi:hypothetical protein
MNIPKREIFIAAVLLFLAFCGLNVFWLGSFSVAIVFKLPLWTGFFIFAAVLYICLASKGWFEKLHKWRQEKTSHKPR